MHRLASGHQCWYAVCQTCKTPTCDGGKLSDAGRDCVLPSAHRSVVSAESTQLFVCGEHAARPRYLDCVCAQGHAVSVRRRHTLLLADQNDAQLRSPAARCVVSMESATMRAFAGTDRDMCSFSILLTLARPG